jgi:hypothetical protein
MSFDDKPLNRISEFQQREKELRLEVGEDEQVDLTLSFEALSEYLRISNEENEDQMVKKEVEQFEQEEKMFNKPLSDILNWSSICTTKERELTFFASSGDPRGADVSLRIFQRKDNNQTQIYVSTKNSHQKFDIIIDKKKDDTLSEN